MCHVSHVTCQVSHVIKEKKKEKMDKVVKLVSQGSVINGTYTVQFLQKVRANIIVVAFIYLYAKIALYIT